MTKSLIIYFPFHINLERPSPTTLRPLCMIEAFRAIGYEVEVVQGYARERKAACKRLTEEIKSGRKFELIYSEASTMPTLLTEKHHLPTHPPFDFRFLGFCKSMGIPIGLFYRDVYWLFSQLIGWKTKLVRPFYRYDLLQYRQLLSALFLPTMHMSAYIPGHTHFSGRVHELPPAVEVIRPLYPISQSEKINIFYVGGIGRHYNLRLIVQAVAKRPDLTLTLCVREDDWVLEVANYLPLFAPNIRVVHAKGEQLIDYYQHAHYFCIYVEPIEYWRFAAPFKLFEAMGYGIPILASEGTWVADFVKTNRIGLTAPYTQEGVEHLLDQLPEHPISRKHIIQLATKNTWEQRAEKVVSILTNKHNQ